MWYASETINGTVNGTVNGFRMITRGLVRSMLVFIHESELGKEISIPVLESVHVVNVDCVDTS